MDEYPVQTARVLRSHRPGVYFTLSSPRSLSEIDAKELEVPSFKDELRELEQEFARDRKEAEYQIRLNEWASAFNYAAIDRYAAETKRMLEASGIEMETGNPISLQDVNALLWGQPVVPSSMTKKPIGREMLSNAYETSSGFIVIKGGKKQEGKKQDGKRNRRRDSRRIA